MINSIYNTLKIIATSSFFFMGIINLLPKSRDLNFAGINFALFVLYVFLYFKPIH